MRRRFVLVILIACIVVLYAGEIIFKNNNTTGGIKIENIKREIKELQVENINLQEELYKAQSFRVINDRAKEMGFIELNKNQIIYL